MGTFLQGDFYEEDEDPEKIRAIFDAGPHGITAPPVKHPAKYSDSIIETLDKVMLSEAERNDARLRVLDPMAGVGRIHELDRSCVYATIGVEIEPEWATQHPGTIIADASTLPFQGESFDATITSPAYGNRMADHHNAKDDSRRMTYKHVLGRDLSPNSGAGLQWGHPYRELHTKILSEMVRVTKPDGLVVVNISNHVRKGVVQHVVEWYAETMCRMALLMERVIPVPTPRMRFGENGTLRVPYEHVIVMRKGV